MKGFSKHSYLVISIFIVLFLLNLVRIYVEFNTYNSFHKKASITELETIVKDMQKVSDSIFENIINQKDVVSIFEGAHIGDDEQKGLIRESLYEKLVDQYEKFTMYGVQQLHFHLPNNDSFLRFHKPKKFGDNLSKVRESVKYVNENKKRTSGFEEGKIFNGYRFVYPLFSSDGTHIGSVEISSSLLNFKKMYQRNHLRHVDFIFLKDDVEKKLFAEELKNYTDYFGSKNYYIQTTIDKYNQENCDHYKHLHSFMSDKKIIEQVKKIDSYTFSKLLENEIYTIDFIPLYNDFLYKKVGYYVLFSKSNYIEYFYISVIGSFVSVLVFSLLAWYLLYLNRKRGQTELEKRKVELKNENLLVSYQFVSSVIDGTKDLIFYKDKYFNYLGCNESFAKYVGKTKEEIIGKNDFDLFPNKEATVFRNNDNIALQKSDLFVSNLWVKYSSGEDVYLQTQKMPFQYDENDKNCVGILGISRDLTELYVTQQKLKEQTYTDELTQIRNRKAYNEKINELLSNYRRYKTVFSVILIDIDNFKSINDTYGHHVGDDTLVGLCSLVNNSIRESDHFFRIGGEEFAIFTTHSAHQGALVLAENIRKKVQNELDLIEDRVITISLGVSSVQDGDTDESIFKRVDNFLYESKNNGKNRITSD